MTELRCPRCGEPATTAHLKTSPECAKAVQTLCARYRVAQRKRAGQQGGRKPQMVECPRCGKQVSATAARRGHIGCVEQR